MGSAVCMFNVWRGWASICYIRQYASSSTQWVTRELYLLYPRPQEAPHQELEPLKLSLYNNQLEIRLRIHISRLVFHQFNLPQSVSDPSLAHQRKL